MEFSGYTVCACDSGKQPMVDFVTRVMDEFLAPAVFVASDDPDNLGDYRRTRTITGYVLDGQGVDIYPVELTVARPGRIARAASFIRRVELSTSILIEAK